MGRFSKFLGKVSIEIDKETINLNSLDVEDVQKIVDLSKKKENEIVEGVKVLSDIVSKNYPEEPIEEIKAFVLKNYSTLIEEIIIALGWTTREKLEKQKKEETEKKNQ